MGMKKIKVNFVDFQSDLLKNNDFLNVLRKSFDVEISDRPDYLFYGVFGNQHLKFKDCVRIFYTGECITPNFNECDYAIGFDRLKLGDRYLRMPLYALFQYRQSYESILNKERVSKEELAAKSDFCSFVVSNGFAQEARVQFFRKLSEYKKVNSGGRYLNNIGGAVVDKLKFQMKHKFCICFENNSYSGYTTEKIVEAFASRTIPIYYGDPTVCEDFNEGAFVDANKFTSFDEVIERIIELDNDDTKYLSMINAPIIKNELSLSCLEQFLCHIINQDINEAKRRPCSKNQIEFEAMVLRHRFFEKRIYNPYHRLKSLLKKINNGSIIWNRKKQ